jgi:hypothetical protein
MSITTSWTPYSVHRCICLRIFKLSTHQHWVIFACTNWSQFRLQHRNPLFTLIWSIYWDLPKQFPLRRAFSLGISPCPIQTSKCWTRAQCGKAGLKWRETTRESSSCTMAGTVTLRGTLYWPKDAPPWETE